MGIITTIRTPCDGSLNNSLLDTMSLTAFELINNFDKMQLVWNTCAHCTANLHDLKTRSILAVCDCHQNQLITEVFSHVCNERKECLD